MSVAPSLERPLESLRFAHTLTTALATKDFPEAKACHQPSATDNHLIWNLGHLAATYQWLGTMMGGQKALPETYNTLFGGGSKPLSDSKAYPSLTEVKATYESEFNRFVKLIESMPEAALSTPTPEAQGFAKDRLELVHRAAWHEGWHAGQISSIRRALGLSGIF